MTATAWSPQPNTIPVVNPSGLFRSEVIQGNAGQRVVHLSTFAYTINTQSLFVFKNGNALTPGYDFVESDGTTFILSDQLTTSDTIVAMGFTGITGSATVDPVLRSDLASTSGGSRVGITRSGASILRTVADKFNDFINVKDFGAKGDGVTDDSAAIQAAFDYAATLTLGATIYFAAGDYLVTKTLSLLCDKVGIKGNGSSITASGFSQSTVLFSINHSPVTVFPSFKIFAIEGMLFQSTGRLGICFSVVGAGVDKFSSQIHYKHLNIKNFHIAFNYGDYAFSPMITECSIAGVDQVFKQAGSNSTGAHFVFDKCLFTSIGNKIGQIVAFDFGGVNTYKFIACDLESCAYTAMTSSGSDVYLYGCHMELDVGAAGAPLFTVTNTDYGHFAFEHCTGFWWQSTSDVPPLYSIGPRMSAFAIGASRIILNNGITPASNTMLSTYYHPFLANFGVTLKSLMQPKSGQGYMYSGPGNNAFSNWDFSGPLTLDFTAGGAGVATVQVVADRPFGTASCLEIGRSGSATTGFIPIPDNAQTMMAAFWGNTTFYSAGLMNLEMHLFNANQQEIGVYTQNITGGAVGTWQRFDINLLRTISDKKAKFLKFVFVANAGTVNRIAYPFVDFA